MNKFIRIFRYTYLKVRKATNKCKIAQFRAKKKRKTRLELKIWVSKASLRFIISGLAPKLQNVWFFSGLSIICLWNYIHYVDISFPNILRFIWVSILFPFTHRLHQQNIFFTGYFILHYHTFKKNYSVEIIYNTLVSIFTQIVYIFLSFVLHNILYFSLDSIVFIYYKISTVF